MTTTGRTTLAEIAREANVAVSTVSKVLNGHPDVAVPTRLRIEQLLARRGYRRTPAPRRTPRRTALIDLVLDEPDSAWGLAVLSGVGLVAGESGLGLIVSTREGTGTLLPRGSEGAILALSALGEHQRADLERRSIPFVLVGAVSPAAPSIGATDFTGGYTATEHLVALGHHRIGLITGPRHHPCARARTAGYHAALDAAGLPADPDLVIPARAHHEDGLAAALTLLSLPTPPTAIFAADDHQAAGAYEAGRRTGRTIPHDLSITGFGDLPFARWLAPALTTVRYPLHEMGLAAARTLLRLVDNDPLESPHIELATTLVTRASTTRFPVPRTPETATKALPY
ncbi:LacI family DNA-binding transcriptional regulator [Actinoplanes sp. NPDC051494]|uniref:LacI family DNA-binding transcriptional regulator n=1 Tax=Actinoplanes sp. NPDC051494 TaxID=3363907 RepID=UPI00378EBCF6